MGASRRKTLPLRTSLAASTIPSGVRKLTHPTSSSSPKTPQLESAGAPGLIGSSENLGILLKAVFAMIRSPLLILCGTFNRELRRYVSSQHATQRLEMSSMLGDFIAPV